MLRLTVPQRDYLRRHIADSTVAKINIQNSDVVIHTQDEMDFLVGFFLHCEYLKVDENTLFTYFSLKGLHTLKVKDYQETKERLIDAKVIRTNLKDELEFIAVYPRQQTVEESRQAVEEPPQVSEELWQAVEEPLQAVEEPRQAVEEPQQTVEVQPKLSAVRHELILLSSQLKLIAEMNDSSATSETKSLSLLALLATINPDEVAALSERMGDNAVDNGYSPSAANKKRKSTTHEQPEPDNDPEAEKKRKRMAKNSESARNTRNNKKLAQLSTSKLLMTLSAKAESLSQQIGVIEGGQDTPFSAPVSLPAGDLLNPASEVEQPQPIPADQLLDVPDPLFDSSLFNGDLILASQPVSYSRLHSLFPDSTGGAATTERREEFDDAFAQSLLGDLDEFLKSTEGLVVPQTPTLE